MSRKRAARYAAPIAFLAAITIAALLIRPAFQHPSSAKTPATTATTLAQTTRTHTHAKKTGGSRYYRVRPGDTFGLIAQRLGTSVVRLEHLNPGVDPSTLVVGQKIRVK